MFVSLQDSFTGDDRFQSLLTNAVTRRLSQILSRNLVESTLPRLLLLLPDDDVQNEEQSGLPNYYSQQQNKTTSAKRKLQQSLNDPILRQELISTFEGRKRLSALLEELLIPCVKQFTLLHWAVADLDYLACSDSLQTTTWQAFKATPVHQSHDALTFHPDAVLGSFRQSFQPFFKHHAHAEMKNGKLWLRVVLFESVLNESLPSETSVAVIVHTPMSPYIIMRKLRPKFQQFIVQALMVCMKLSSIVEYPVQGKSLKYVDEMLLGNVYDHLENNETAHPLAKSEIVKPALALKSLHDENVEVLAESTASSRLVERQVTAAFKSTSVTPISSLSIDMRSKLPGRSDRIVQCRITLTGKSVGDALKDWVDSSLTPDRSLKAIQCVASWLAARRQRITVEDGVLSENIAT